MEEMITLTFKDAQGNTQQFEIVDAAAREALESCVTKDANGNVSIEGVLRFLQSSSSYQNCYIRAIDGDANGSVLLIRPGASLIAGGGEYATNRWGVGDIDTTNEKTYVGADSNVYIETNGNTIANRKTWTFDTSGNITTPTGGLINGVDVTKINQHGVVQTLSPTMSIPSGTAWQNVMSFDLTPGLWYVEFTCRFTSNATGYRGLNISTTSGGSAQTYLLQDLRQAVTGSITYCKISGTYYTASSVTRYVNAVQNSGSALTLSMQYKLTLLKDEA